MKFKAYTPHIIAIVFFILLSVSYFIKPLTEGKKLYMPDTAVNIGAKNEVVTYRENTGEQSLWTNSMFGGMPTYLIINPKPAELLRQSHKILNLNHIRPINFIFLYLIGFYIALICFSVNPWISILGSIAYAFSSYFFIIIEAGHATKVMALGYLPTIIGGIHLAFHGKRILGSIIVTFFLALQIIVNHLQITYYTLIITLVYGTVFLIYSIKTHSLKDFLITSAFLLMAALIAVGSNLGVLMPVMEYSKYSTRGKSELVVDAKNQTSGLDKDYATEWSYGIPESFTLLIPNFMGGPSASSLPEKSETFKLYEKYQGAKAAKEAIKRQPTYWGKQRFTSGPVYVGAIVCLLFVFAFYVVERKHLWWLVSVTIISLILSWGKYIPAVTSFLLDHLPGYNKFRAVSMSLVIAEFSMPLLAILALSKLFKDNLHQEKVLKALKYSLGITGGILLFFILFAKGLFSFDAPSDQQYLSQNGGTLLVDALKADRLMLLKRDAARALIFILLASGIVFLYIKKKIKTSYALVGIALLILFDMWGINKRYLNNDNFVAKQKISKPYEASPADKSILSDKTLNYRVLNLAVDPFNDASTSYFHKSIGGYHGAKMQRYQELITFNISKEMQKIYGSFRSQDFKVISSTLESCNALNILNTKYIIYNPQAKPLINSSALGNAWFVDKIKWVKNANEEIEALNSFNSKKEAVIDEKFNEQLNGFNHIEDSTRTIELVHYSPNKLIYNSNCSTEQLAVFSEIYYPKGWKVRIDGVEKDHFRANYVLRAMKVPSGKHEIEFFFEPETYYTGQRIATASSALLLFLIIGFVVNEFYRKRKLKDSI